jgi:imidazolonepropionase-like amidohydrolase
MGRPKIAIDISRVEELAAQGLTLAEICLVLGISERTLYDHKRESAVLADAIKSGRAKAASEISNVLYQMARKGDLGAIVWYEKTRRGLSDKIQHTVDVRHLSDDELRAIVEG